MEPVAYYMMMANYQQQAAREVAAQVADARLMRGIPQIGGGARRSVRQQINRLVFRAQPSATPFAECHESVCEPVKE